MTVQERLPESRASFTQVFTEALRGRPCRVVGLGAEPEALPVRVWRREADPSDLALLALCDGHTVDLGCGPGRLSVALARLGHVVLGVDIVREAVDQALVRGVAALRRDVFERLPGEGRWHSALLADGNVGIGGDPGALLRRAAELVEPGGRVVAELAGPGVPPSTRWAVLDCEGVRSAPFRWATVGVDDIHALARTSGWGRVEVQAVGGGRWAAILRRTTPRPVPGRMMEG
jgi:SAM-dependent methyltransferase